MQKIKKICSYMTTFFLSIIFLYILLMQYMPEHITKQIGFRSYVVLTDSMEPTIPTYSIVFSKNVDETTPIKRNSIVTFKAIRDGKNVLITHYYRKQQIGADGTIYYRTQPEGIHNEYDHFETTRKDIIGTYLFHIPYIGKFVLFLQSKFSIIFYFELLVILLLNLTIKAHWKDKLDAEVHIKKVERNVKIKKAIMYEKQDIGGYEIHATLYNTFILSRRDICVNLALFNKQGNVTYFAHHLLVAEKYLHFKQSVDVIIPIQTNTEVDHFEIAISKYRM